jgi:hypothetical protein
MEESRSPRLWCWPQPGNHEVQETVGGVWARLRRFLAAKDPAAQTGPRNGARGCAAMGAPLMAVDPTQALQVSHI